MQHACIADSSLSDAELVQLAAVAANGVYDALDAFVADFVVGEEERGERASAGRQRHLHSIGGFSCELIVCEVKVPARVAGKFDSEDGADVGRGCTRGGC